MSFEIYDVKENEKEMFKRYKGKWEIQTLLKNKRAQEFWRKVVKEASDGNYQEHLIEDLEIDSER